MSRRHASAAARNAGPILEVLRQLLPGPATVLELGSGTGEHAVFFARHLPWVTWQPSDPDDASLASIAGWLAAVGLPNVLPPLRLDLLAPSWRLRRADLLLAVNVLHRAPHGAAVALVAGACEVLPRGGHVVVVGPFARQCSPLSARWRRVDVASRAGGGEGLPVLEHLADDARAHDLVPGLVTSLPDETTLLVARRL